MTTPADWMTAFGTLGVFGVSLYLLGRDQKYRDQTLSREKGEQFRLVSAWTETLSGSGQLDENGQHVSTWTLAVCALNSSQESVHHVSVKVIARVGGDAGGDVLATEGAFFNLVPPKPEPSRTTIDVKVIDHEAEPWWYVELHASDTTGAQWQRDHRGQVKLMFDPEQWDHTKYRTTWRRRAKARLVRWLQR